MKKTADEWIAELGALFLLDRPDLKIVELPAALWQELFIRGEATAEFDSEGKGQIVVFSNDSVLSFQAAMAKAGDAIGRHSRTLTEILTAHVDDRIALIHEIEERSAALLIWGDAGPPTFPDILKLIDYIPGEYDGEPRNREERRQSPKQLRAAQRAIEARAYRPAVGRNHFHGAPKRSRRGQR